MGTVVNLSEPALDLALYGNRSELIGNYLQNQMQQLPQAFNQFTDRLWNSMQQTYHFVTDKLTQFNLMNQLQQNQMAIPDFQFQTLTDFEQLQNANLTMQRWVMAHPQMKQMYVNQHIDAYSESYKPVTPKAVGDDDYDYRRVMNGIIIPTDEGCKVVTYQDDIHPNDHELTMIEQHNVLMTWEAIDSILEMSKFDFTVTSKEPIKRYED